MSNPTRPVWMLPATGAALATTASLIGGINVDDPNVVPSVKAKKLLRTLVLGAAAGLGAEAMLRGGGIAYRGLMSKSSSAEQIKRFRNKTLYSLIKQGEEGDIPRIPTVPESPMVPTTTPETPPIPGNPVTNVAEAEKPATPTSTETNTTPPAATNIPPKQDDKLPWHRQSPLGIPNGYIGYGLGTLAGAGLLYHFLTEKKKRKPSGYLNSMGAGLLAGLLGYGLYDLSQGSWRQGNNTNNDNNNKNNNNGIVKAVDYNTGSQSDWRSKVNPEAAGHDDGVIMHDINAAREAFQNQNRLADNYNNRELTFNNPNWYTESDNTTNSFINGILSDAFNKNPYFNKAITTAVMGPSAAEALFDINTSQNFYNNPTAYNNETKNTARDNLREFVYDLILENTGSAPEATTVDNTVNNIINSYSQSADSIPFRAQTLADDVTAFANWHYNVRFKPNNPTIDRNPAARQFSYASAIPHLVYRMGGRQLTQDEFNQLNRLATQLETDIYQEQKWIDGEYYKVPPEASINGWSIMQNLLTPGDPSKNSQNKYTEGIRAVADTETSKFHQAIQRDQINIKRFFEKVLATPGESILPTPSEMNASVPPSTTVLPPGATPSNPAATTPTGVSPSPSTPASWDATSAVDSAITGEPDIPYGNIPVQNNPAATGNTSRGTGAIAPPPPVTPEESDGITAGQILTGLGLVGGTGAYVAHKNPIIKSPAQLQKIVAKNPEGPSWISKVRTYLKSKGQLPGLDTIESMNNFVEGNISPLNYVDAGLGDNTERILANSQSITPDGRVELDTAKVQDTAAKELEILKNNKAKLDAEQVNYFAKNKQYNPDLAAKIKTIDNQIAKWETVAKAGTPVLGTKEVYPTSESDLVSAIRETYGNNINNPEIQKAVDKLEGRLTQIDNWGLGPQEATQLKQQARLQFLSELDQANAAIKHRDPNKIYDYWRENVTKPQTRILGENGLFETTTNPSTWEHTLYPEELNALDRSDPVVEKLLKETRPYNETRQFSELVANEKARIAQETRYKEIEALVKERNIARANGDQATIERVNADLKNKYGIEPPKGFDTDFSYNPQANTDAALRNAQEIESINDKRITSLAQRYYETKDPKIRNVLIDEFGVDPDAFKPALEQEWINEIKNAPKPRINRNIKNTLENLVDATIPKATRATAAEKGLLSAILSQNPTTTEVSPKSPLVRLDDTPVSTPVSQNPVELVNQQQKAVENFHPLPTAEEAKAQFQAAQRERINLLDNIAKSYEDIGLVEDAKAVRDQAFSERLEQIGNKVQAGKASNKELQLWYLNKPEAELTAEMDSINDAIAQIDVDIQKAKNNPNPSKGIDEEINLVQQKNNLIQRRSGIQQARIIKAKVNKTAPTPTSSENTLISNTNPIAPSTTRLTPEKLEHIVTNIDRAGFKGNYGNAEHIENAINDALSRLTPEDQEILLKRLAEKSYFPKKFESLLPKEPVLPTATSKAKLPKTKVPKGGLILGLIDAATRGIHDSKDEAARYGEEAYDAAIQRGVSPEDAQYISRNAYFDKLMEGTGKGIVNNAPPVALDFTLGIPAYLNSGVERLGELFGVPADYSLTPDTSPLKLSNLDAGHRSDILPTVVGTTGDTAIKSLKSTPKLLYNLVAKPIQANNIMKEEREQQQEQQRREYAEEQKRIEENEARRTLDFDEFEQWQAREKERQAKRIPDKYITPDIVNAAVQLATKSENEQLSALQNMEPGRANAIIQVMNDLRKVSGNDSDPMPTITAPIKKRFLLNP